MKNKSNKPKQMVTKNETERKIKKRKKEKDICYFQMVKLMALLKNSEV